MELGYNWFVFVTFTPLRQSRLNTWSVYCDVDLLVIDSIA